MNLGVKFNDNLIKFEKKISFKSFDEILRRKLTGISRKFSINFGKIIHKI